jgi:uncharacterized membrane protein YfcA
VDPFVLVLVLLFGTAVLFAPLGLGGGMLFVPILLYVGGWEVASSTFVMSLTLTLCVSVGSGWVHRKEGLMDGALIRTAAPAAMVGATMGALVVSQLGEALDPVFKGLAMLLVGWACVKTWRKVRGNTPQQRTGEVRRTPLRIGAGFGGMASAVLAIGAGAVYIPILNQFGGVSDRRAIGTSLGLMVLVVPVAVVMHASLFEGTWPPLWQMLTAPVAVVGGGVLGAKIGLKLPDAVILKVFFGLLVVIFSRYAIDVVGTYL